MTESVVINSRDRALPVQTIHHLLGMLPTWFLTVAGNASSSEGSSTAVVLPLDSKPTTRNSRRVKTRFYSYEVYWAAMPETKPETAQPSAQQLDTEQEQPKPSETQWIVRQTGS